jgi:ankyrin repeat protein
VVIKKFLSYIEDIKFGKIDGSELSQSLDYVTAEDGGSELIWKSLRADLEISGVSTALVDKYRGLITTKFKEILESGALDALGGEGNDPSMGDREHETSEDTETAGSKTELDISENELFFTLASKGHTKRISTMIQLGMLPDTRDDHGNTALHLAAIAGHVRVVELLLASGAHANLRDAQGWMATRHALENGHHAVLRAIVNHDPESHSINMKVDRMGHIILHYAVSYGDDDSVLLLLKAGANPNAQNWLNQTPLHLAAWRRDLMVLKHILEADVDLGFNIEDLWGDTALEVAMCSPVTTTDKSAVIRMFLEGMLAREQKQQGLDFDLDDAVEFLTMESIYDYNSENNIFKAPLEGRSVAELLLKQFEMNDLAQELFEKIYSKYTI